MLEAPIFNGINSLLARLSAARAAFLDAPVSSRAAAETALSNTIWTAERAARLDQVATVLDAVAAIDLQVPGDLTTQLANLVTLINARASAADWTAARAALIDRLDAAVSSRAAAADWTPGRAAKVDSLDAAISSRASAADWTALRAAKVDNLDATVASRAAASTALSTSNWTAARAALLDRLDAAISSRAAAADYTGARAALLDRLDATISSRAPATTALSTADWTAARALKLDLIETLFASSQAMGSSVEALLTNTPSAAFWTDALAAKLNAALGSTSSVIRSIQTGFVSAVRADTSAFSGEDLRFFDVTIAAINAINKTFVTFQPARIWSSTEPVMNTARMATSTKVRLSCTFDPAATAPTTPIICGRWTVVEFN